MVALNCMVALVVAGSLWAADDGKRIEVADPAWGTFTIKLDKADRPVQNPVVMDLSVLCKDQRTAPNSVKPKPEELLDHDKICMFNTYTFDKEQKQLTLVFTISKTENDQAKCTDHKKQTFDLKKLCEPWTSVAK